VDRLPKIIYFRYGSIYFVSRSTDTKNYLVSNCNCLFLPYDIALERQACTWWQTADLILEYLEYLWMPCVADADMIFLPCGFFLLFIPRLISAVGAWMFTILPHILWPSCEFRMQV